MSGLGALLDVQARTLYRVLAGVHPTRRDFQSDAELGREPRGEQVTDRRQYQGISMFDRKENATKVARKFGLGQVIAEVRIPHNRGDIAISKTRGAHHFSVEGNALGPRQLVVAVHSLDSVE